MNRKFAFIWEYILYNKEFVPGKLKFITDENKFNDRTSYTDTITETTAFWHQEDYEKISRKERCNEL